VGAIKTLGPADESLAGQPRKGCQPIRGSGRTQAPDPTPVPLQNRASRAGSTIHSLPADSVATSSCTDGLHLDVQNVQFLMNMQKLRN